MTFRASTNRRARALAAATLGAMVALSLVPAAAAPNPGEVAFVGAYADDGIINAVEAAAADPAGRPVEWTDPATSVSAEGRFTDGAGVTIPGGACGPFTLAPSGTGTTGYLNLGCMGAAPDGEIQWRVRWFDGVDFTPEAIDSLIVDRAISAVEVLTPGAGSLQKGLVPFTGTAEPGSEVQLFEGATLLAKTDADAAGTWSSPKTMTTGTHTVQAVALDDAGNSAVSPAVTFDVDAQAPTGEIDTINLSIYEPGSDVLLEGWARDTNGQAFGGALAVEVNIHSLLVPAIQLGNLPPDGLEDLLGAARIGTVISQDNADCTPAGPVTQGMKTCSASGAQLVTWAYDASFLPPGVYTFQVKFFDKAGNTPAQAAQITIVRL